MTIAEHPVRRGQTDRCRICGSTLIRDRGVVEHVRGYAWTVHDCSTCGCRFTRHDNAVYDLFHQSGAISYYAEYRELAADAQRYFRSRDREGLKRLLCASAKYNYVISEAEHAPRNAQVLEIGCSRGYLTSWFILAGMDVLGVDISPEAVESARAAFGDHFALPDAAGTFPGEAYDIIYHVGMIGCVADPVGLTKQLLGMLKPGGFLLFNAPNRAALRNGQLWFDTAPPPDLVTLFPPDFWRARFGALADVAESFEMCDAKSSIRAELRRFFGRSWRAPVPISLSADAARPRFAAGASDRVWSLFERAVCKLAAIAGFDKLAPRLPAEFGMLVKMTARQASNG